MDGQLVEKLVEIVSISFEGMLVDNTTSLRPHVARFGFRMGCLTIFGGANKKSSSTSTSFSVQFLLMEKIPLGCAERAEQMPRWDAWYDMESLKGVQWQCVRLTISLVGSTKKAFLVEQTHQRYTRRPQVMSHSGFSIPYLLTTNLELCVRCDETYQTLQDISSFSVACTYFPIFCRSFSFWPLTSLISSRLLFHQIKMKITSLLFVVTLAIPGDGFQFMSKWKMPTHDPNQAKIQEQFGDKSKCI